MENFIFRRPAVAGLMQAGFVEARHHVDLQKTLTEAQFTHNRALRDRLAQSGALPFYVVVDPRTGQKLGEHVLSGGPGAWEGRWIEFLQRMLQQAGKPLPGAK